jgi:hypothetical protein
MARSLCGLERRRFQHVPARRHPLSRYQHATIRFVCYRLKQSDLFGVRLGQSQSAISDSALIGRHPASLNSNATEPGFKLTKTDSFRVGLEGEFAVCVAYKIERGRQLRRPLFSKCVFFFDGLSAAIFGPIPALF